jgi:hypothetical protein
MSIDIGSQHEPIGTSLQRDTFQDITYFWNKGTPNEIRLKILAKNRILLLSQEDQQVLQQNGNPEQVVNGPEQRTLDGHGIPINEQQKDACHGINAIDHFFTEGEGFVILRGWIEDEEQPDREPESKEIMMTKAHLRWLGLTEEDIEWLNSAPGTYAQLLGKLDILAMEAEMKKQSGTKLTESEEYMIKMPILPRIVRSRHIIQELERQHPEEDVRRVHISDSLEKALDAHPLLKPEIEDRYKATNEFLAMALISVPIEASLIVGSTTNPDKIRPGKRDKPITSFSDLKEGPSDIDLMVMVDLYGEEEGALAKWQSQLDALSRDFLKKSGYFIHVQVADAKKLLTFSNQDDEWFHGAKKLVHKIKTGKEE